MFDNDCIFILYILTNYEYITVVAIRGKVLNIDRLNVTCCVDNVLHCQNFFVSHQPLFLDAELTLCSSHNKSLKK